MKITGEGAEDKIVTKNINVQKNPSRGAKIAPHRSNSKVSVKHEPRMKAIEYSPGKNIIKVCVKFAVGMEFDKLLTCLYLFRIYFNISP